MVAYLEKSTGSAGFHQIIDFINRSHICYALTKKPEVCVSFVKQFWRTAEIATNEDGNVKIHATIDGHSLFITEAFCSLALMGLLYSDKLTFQNGAFSLNGGFFIPSLLHCLSRQEDAWGASLVAILQRPVVFDVSQVLLTLPRYAEDFKFVQQHSRIGVLEADLSQTKKIYSSAYTKLILRVKKLESQIKVGKARRHSRFVLSDTEVGEDDSSKQGRKFSNEGFQDDEGVHEKASTETELFIQEVTPTEIIHEQEGSGKVSDEISTAGKKKDTASEEVPPVSTAEVQVSTAGGTATYSRRSAEKRKDKGKGIMIEEEPKKKSKKELEQERLSYAEALGLRAVMNEEQSAQSARMQRLKTIGKMWKRKGNGLKLRRQRVCPLQWIVEEESGAQEERKETVNETVNEPAAKRKKSIPRKTTRKRQKLEVETEKEELKTFLDIRLTCTIKSSEVMEAQENIRLLMNMLKTFEEWMLETIFQNDDDEGSGVVDVVVVSGEAAAEGWQWRLDGSGDEGAWGSGLSRSGDGESFGTWPEKSAEISCFRRAAGGVVVAGIRRWGRGCRIEREIE
ncbi:hypothetical protein Tco_0173113 [Tanacetum coccineum]